MRVLLIILATSFIFGCGVTGGNSPNFVIQNFSIQKKEYKLINHTDYIGSGLVITKDPSLQKGDVILFLKATDKTISADVVSDYGVSERTQEIQVLLHDGIGNLRTSKFQTDNTLPPPAPPEYSWEVIGFMKLQPASVQTGQ